MEDEINYLADWEDSNPDEAVELRKYIDYLLNESADLDRKFREGLISEIEKDIYQIHLADLMNDVDSSRYWDQLRRRPWEKLELPDDENFPLKEN